MSTIAVIQCTNVDLYKSKNPDDYCISSLKKSGMFDTIILAIPKQEKSTVFDEFLFHYLVVTSKKKQII